MPLVRSEGPGNVAIASGEHSLQRTLTFIAAGETIVTDALTIASLPRQVFWLNQTVGAAGGTVTLQWSRNDVFNVGLSVMEPDWKPYDAPFVLIPGGLAPTLRNFAFVAKLCRISIVMPANVGGSTVEVLIGSHV